MTRPSSPDHFFGQSPDPFWDEWVREWSNPFLSFGTLPLALVRSLPPPWDHDVRTCQIPSLAAQVAGWPPSRPPRLAAKGGQRGRHIQAVSWCPLARAPRPEPTAHAPSPTTPPSGRSKFRAPHPHRQGIAWPGRARLPPSKAGLCSARHTKASPETHPSCSAPLK